MYPYFLQVSKLDQSENKKITQTLKNTNRLNRFSLSVRIETYFSVSILQSGGYKFFSIENLPGVINGWFFGKFWPNNLTLKNNNNGKIGQNPT